MRMLEELLANPIATRSVRIVVMLVAALATLWLTNVVVGRIARSLRRTGALGPTEGEKRLKTVSSIARYAVFVVVATLLVSGILSELGFSVGPFLGTLGIAGVVIGLGAQNLVRDYISGLLLLLENHYAVDDWVRLAGVDGRVEKVTLRMTQLRDLDGNVHIVPNGEIKLVTNVTKEWTRVVVDVAVAYKEDIDRVVGVLEQVGAEMMADPVWASSILEPLQIKAIQNLRDSGVEIRLVYKTTPEQQWDIRRDLMRRVKARFDLEGIEIPFPHRTLYIGQGEGGALRVETPDR